MSDIPPINLAASLGINLVSRERGFGIARGGADEEIDHVEISELAQRLSVMGDASGIRREKVAAIREEIAAGNYETPEKIDVTVDRLLSVLMLDE